MRWSGPGFAEELRGLCTSARGPQPAPPNVSVVVGERKGRSRTKHYVYAQGTQLLVTSHDAAVIRAVIRALSILGTEPPEGTLPLRAVLLLHADGTATAVDGRLTEHVNVSAAHLARGGHRLIATPRLALRPAAASVELPEWECSVGVSPEELNRRHPLGREGDPMISGTVRLKRFAHIAKVPPSSLAAAIAEVVPLTTNGARTARTDDVARLADLAGRVRFDFAPGWDPKLVRAVLESP